MSELSPDKRDEDSADATARMLPCPSCEETDVDATYALGAKVGGDRYYQAGCMVCGMTGPESHTRRDSADRWNALPRRTTPSHALQITGSQGPKHDGLAQGNMITESAPSAGAPASPVSTTPRIATDTLSEIQFGLALLANEDGENLGKPEWLTSVKKWAHDMQVALEETTPSATPCIGGFTMVGLNTIRFEREEDATTVMNVILRSHRTPRSAREPY